MRTLAALPLLAAFAVGLLACASDPSQPGFEIDPINTAGEDDADAGGGADAGPSEKPAATNPDGGKDQPKPDTSGATNVCETAEDLGTMAGDHLATLEDVIIGASRQGHCSKWLKIRLTEEKYDKVEMGLKAQLTSPTSKKFDLYGYVNAVKDVVECKIPTATSATTLGNVDTAEVSWDDPVFSASDDSRTVTLEVRSRDGSCDPSGTWSLVVTSVNDYFLPTL